MKLLHSFVFLLFIGLTALQGQDFRLVCPGDVTISCTENYSDLNKWGKAYTDENGFIKWQHDCKVVYNINDCGVGTITRTWGVENPNNWQWLTCTQVITLSNANAFGYRDITFPQDITIESCNPQDSVKHLPRPYDKPTWKTNKCARPMVNYSDEVFRVNDGCVKIIRTWKILDWCVYDPYKNPGIGIFTAQQVIKLITIDPDAKISCPKDTIVVASQDCNGVYVKIDPATVVSPCKMPFVIHNTSKYADSTGNDASGFYPNGTTKFYYIAEYGCGSEIKCELTVIVKNTIPPTPYCLTGVIVDLMPVDQDLDGIAESGMIEVWASDLNKASFHKCPKQKLRYSFSKDVLDRARIFTCAELGENEVEMWVTDSLGNADLCKTKIIIQNNLNVPDCKRKDSLGHVRYDLSISFWDETRKQKKTNLRLSLENMVSHVITPAAQDQNASYILNGLRKDQEYELKYAFTGTEIKGIDLFDVQLLEDHLKGRRTITDPYRLLAADLNADAIIDHTDLQLLKDLIGGVLKPSSLPEPYKMIPEGFGTNATTILQDYNQLKLRIPVHQETSMEKNYLLLRTGDVSAFGPALKKVKLSASDKE
ncbi:MAG: hypothetical protein IPF46_04435 [Saprospiraceae bacterium]|nr:hypothetical protein [Candidatus Vicinibacter affinis]